MEYQFKNLQRTRGDGWDVYLSNDRLFVVNTTTGVRVVDINVDDALIKTLADALKNRVEESAQTNATAKKKSSRKKNDE